MGVHRFVCLTLTTLAVLAAAPARAEPDLAELELAHDALHAKIGQGTLTEGEAALVAHLDQHPGADHARFALGVTRFLKSGERLVQAFHRHGLGDQGRNQWLSMGAMMARLPAPPNPDPQPITHEQFRGIVGAWMDDVRAAEETLAEIDDDEVKLRIVIGQVRFDADADGATTPDDALWRPFAMTRPWDDTLAETAERFDIAFDRGDVEWLCGYCHVCLAFGEFVLAHDTRPLWDHTAQLFFSEPETAFPFLNDINTDPMMAANLSISDLVAFVHLLSFEVIEPQRMRAAHGHLKSAVGRSRAMWGHYDRETDDDREWLPNPNQSSVFGDGGVITEDGRAVWLEALAEADALLDGERLARFWRGDGTRGINIRRFFMEPRRFDLILWIQGAAAAPYLEEGQLTTDELWMRMEQAFGRRVFRHIFWMN